MKHAGYCWGLKRRILNITCWKGPQFVQGGRGGVVAAVVATKRLHILLALLHMLQLE